MPLASWWLALGLRERYSCCRLLSFHFLLMRADSRVLQLVATYTYITGSDKPAIKCTVLSTFRGFEDLRGSRYIKKGKRKKGRKKEGRRKWKKARKRGKGKKNCSSVIFFGQGRETEFLTYWKIPKSNMWLEQSRFKVTFMHKISRMTASLTITNLKATPTNRLLELRKMLC